MPRKDPQARREYQREYQRRWYLVDCGVAYPPFVMDFDHVHGQKSLNVSKLRNSRLAWSEAP